MACESFEDCTIPDPLVDLGPGDRFDSLSKVLFAVMNFMIYAFYAYFMIMVVWSLASAIITLTTQDQDNKETMKIFRTGLTNAVKYIVGLALVASANFFIVWVLQLVGLQDAAEAFKTFKILGTE